MWAHAPSSSDSGIDTRAVWRLAWPVVVSMLSYNAMLLVDALVVGRLGTVPLAAVGLGGTGFFLIRSFGNGLTGGVRIATAQAVGAGRDEDVARLRAQAQWLALGTGLFALSFTPLAGALLALLGGSRGVVEAGTPYLSLLLLGSPLATTQVALGAWLSARGDTRTPMKVALVANAVNAALDPVFVYGWFGAPALGAAGGALSTIVAWALQATLLTIAVRGVVVPSWAPSRRLLGEVWRLGAPLGTQYLIDVAAFAIFAGFLAASGEAHLAAHVLVIRIICISFLPGNGIGEAVGVLAGQAVGAGRPHEVRQAWRAGLTIAVSIMSVLGLVFLLVPDLLVMPFAPAPGVRIVAVDLLAIAACFQLFDALATVSYGALTGAGDTRFAMWVSMLGSWFVKLPLAWVLALPMHWGAPGAWTGLSLEIIVLSMVFAWRVLRVTGGERETAGVPARA